MLTTQNARNQIEADLEAEMEMEVQREREQASWRITFDKIDTIVIRFGVSLCEHIQPYLGELHCLLHHWFANNGGSLPVIIGMSL